MKGSEIYKSNLDKFIKHMHKALDDFKEHRYKIINNLNIDESVDDTINLDNFDEADFINSLLDSFDFYLTTHDCFED